VKTQVDEIYRLALENSMDPLVIKEWQQHVLTLTSLVDSLRNKSHVTALNPYVRRPRHHSASLFGYIF